MEIWGINNNVKKSVFYDTKEKEELIKLELIKLLDEAKIFIEKKKAL